MFENTLTSPGLYPRGEVETSSGLYRLFYTQQSYWFPDNRIILTYYAVRETRRSVGTVNTGEFFDAWAAQDMPVGSPIEAFVAVMGYISSRGSAQLKIL
ncbi:hypothetical protein SODALDRAFT_326301 [Sodiomyces alkalinus F11]|uniref:GH11 domain-containing protein n=1 Tax=Sodiomyces alkalinus (strain CBS 110278 / VKM F-3762 / F11) TaxID=1314773 RepID=A0A3N2Q613_SODAK|nr:hypothetical protein SODALDRAFT_326301 [Sodiomyces alkalinus F11]ROT42137.1 hypothetical protein SODALDRAFT_326301 [Sodiomyces alkalinus F11]